MGCREGWERSQEYHLCWAVTNLPTAILLLPCFTVIRDHMISLAFHSHMTVRRYSFLSPLEWFQMESQDFHHLSVLKSPTPSHQWCQWRSQGSSNETLLPLITRVILAEASWAAGVPTLAQHYWGGPPHLRCQQRPRGKPRLLHGSSPLFSAGAVSKKLAKSEDLNRVQSCIT